MTKYPFQYTACEIAEYLGISVTNAYKRISEMNKEIAGEGFHVIRGRIPKEKFHESYPYVTKEQVDEFEKRKENIS